MKLEDLDRIAKILNGDYKYLHFNKRVSKDFQDSSNKGVPVAMQAFYVKFSGEDIGFCVISISPLKMKSWEKTFIEEGWRDEDFKTGIASFELMYLYIKPDFRQMGFGAKLFGRVLKYAQKTGIKNIYAYVSDTENHALNFYLKEGGKIISNLSEGGNTTAFLAWNNISNG